MSVKICIIHKMIEMALDTIQERGRQLGQHGSMLLYAVFSKNASLEIIWYILTNDLP